MTKSSPWTPQRKGRFLREAAFRYRVEAAGIEPASGDISTGKSTCVVCHFRLAARCSDRQDLQAASPVRSHPALPDPRARPAHQSRRPALGSVGGAKEDGPPSIRQPVHKNSLHLNLYPNCFTSYWELGTLSPSPLSPSKPFAPIGHCFNLTLPQQIVNYFLQR